MTLPLQANLKGLVLAPAQCVVEARKEAAVQYFTTKAMFEDCLHNEQVLPEFEKKYREWIMASKLNRVRGLDAFSVTAYSQGTTESFDKFYLKHHARRFRCFRGEYMYHRLAWDANNMPWSYLDDTPNKFKLQKGDAVVVSWPFADTGNVHHLFNQEFLDECHKKDIPVLIDCAFFGICGHIKFDFDHPAITDICFSLSKSFPLNYLRIGIRFTRVDDNDSLLVYNKTQYVNRLGAALGIKFMQSWDADSNYLQWRTLQEKWCKELNLEPSDSVIFGIDTKHQYDQYNRGMHDSNRLCFSKFYESGVIPKIDYV
jgi:hypothetical protein